MNSIGVAYIASDVNKLDYCLQASMNSTSMFADQISVCIRSGCEDGTLEIVDSFKKKLGPSRVLTSIDDWVFDRYFQAKFRSKAMNMLSTDWIMVVDADEVIHENEASSIKEVVKDPNVCRVSFAVNHYFGLPHWINRNPQWYRRHTRMWRKELKPFCREYPKGTVCSLEARVDDGRRSINSSLTIHHYGHARDSKVMGVKTHRISGWYRNKKDVRDGALPDNVSHEYQIPELGFSSEHLEKAHSSIHPSAVLPWLKAKKFIRWKGSGSDKNVTNYDVYNPIVGNE